MPNIFDGIRKMTDDEIRIQIALLRNVTLLNAAKETSGKVISGLADIANAFAESFSRRTPFDYQVTKVSDMVHSECVALKAKDRVQLEYELKKALIEKCKEFYSEELKGEVSEERLSFLIINEAARVYSIGKYKTPANKLEEISISYNNALLASIHARLIKQNKDELIETDKKIQNSMNEVSLDTKRQLQSVLMPKEFSGRCIGRILRLERATKYLSYTVTYLGYDCFDYVLSNVETVFAAVRGLKRTPRVLFAQLIWSAKRAYGASYKVADNILPSYMTPDERPEFIKEEKEFRSVLSGRIQAENQMEKCDEAFARLEEKKTEAEERMNLQQREYDEQQMKFMGLESRKDDYINNRKPENETKDYYNEVNETKRQLDRVQMELDKHVKQLKEAKDKLEKAEAECNVARLNYEVVKRKTDEEVKKRAISLQKNWQAFFFRFAFADELFERLIVNFTRDEIAVIEEMLKELHDSKDLAALRYENKGENAVTYCELSGGKAVLIEYQKMQILSIERA